MICRGWMLSINLLLAVALPASSTTTDNVIEDERQSDGPVISPPVSEIVLQKGQNYTLYCRGKRKLRIQQQAVPEEDNESGSFQMTAEDDLSSRDSENSFRTALHLYNVDQLAIGYYACIDDTVTNTDFLSDIKEEPTNTEHISFIYIYVNGTNTLFAPMREMVVTTIGTDVLIGCRPTTPDVKVTLNMDSPGSEFEFERYIKYDPKVGYLIDAEDLYSNPSVFICGFERQDQYEFKDVVVHRFHVRHLPEPNVTGESHFFIDGETFSLNCSVPYEPNSAVMLTWTYPADADQSRIHIKTNEQDFHNEQDDIIYNNLTIINATESHAGNYTCTITTGDRNNKKSATYMKNMVTAFINFTGRSDKFLLRPEGKIFSFLFTITCYPPARITYFKDFEDITNNEKYSKKRLKSGSYSLTIGNTTVYHTGNYTLFASNKYLNKSFTYDFRVNAKPAIVDLPTTKYFVRNTVADVKCDVTGYPLPRVNWSFVTENGDQEENIKGNDSVKSLYELTSTLKIKQVRSSGYLTCKAFHDKNEDSKTMRFLVYEIEGGFGIRDQTNTWFSENENVYLTCLGSKYDYDNLTWYRPDLEYDDVGDKVEYFRNEFSIVAKLKLDNINLSQAGKYECIGVQSDGKNRTRSIDISVAERRLIEFQEPNTEENYIETYEFLPVSLSCTVEAVPRPDILWFKDGNMISNVSDMQIQTEELNHTSIKSTIYLQHMEETHKGKYECVATNIQQNLTRFFDLSIKVKSPFKSTYVAIIGLIFFVLLMLVLYLTWKIRKEKKLRKELKAAGMLNFKEGAPGSINPDLGIDEQADLLPYDTKFEFPAEKLILGKQLGAGAFGVVYKAEARGIVNAEETTLCAVKMVKKTADNMYIRALASELKIMVHLGKHVNIVNLLGACTKNVGKRELIVIVEYCKFGCIHTYLQKHRKVFIDQLTENKEKSFGRVNRGFSSSSANSGLHSDYFGYSNQTQGTDDTFLNSANTNRSSRKDIPNQQVESVKGSETSYVQPAWRSNYESDYSYDGSSPRPLFSRDLLCWAFQIARGMEYLASRKILHGDLAARNILLAEDNIVKICDFGLARSIYMNDEYQKKENSPVPIKWLAIECMLDRIFSTQSDVWSFGVVLWELFSLAQTPYPNLGLQEILPWLVAGNRLEKPPYANDKLYDVMRRCWDTKPNCRPSFCELQEILGSFLEDNVRNHYIDLNSPYNDINSAKRAEGVEDYLDMIQPPDYHQMVTPSPHQYVNDVKSFFPSAPTVQLAHDDEGYLQMSPATHQATVNKRAQDTEFDFEARKLNPRVHTPTNSQSELTPMLTLSNLPARTSDSDHDGNTSPYLNMKCKIDEDNEVFEKQNNVRNAATNVAVSNPTYIGIEFETPLDKLPKNNVHYVNTSANGLVK